MPKWFEAFEFVKNPYEKLDPYTIDFQRLVWDRPDLKDVKQDVDRFVEDVINRQRTGLQIIGSAGSGKTWLTRMIQKWLSEKSAQRKEEMLYIYTRIPKVEPVFNVVYRIAIDHFLSDYFEKLSKSVGKPNLGAWKSLIDDDELALCFSSFSSGTATRRAVARKWLTGERLSARELSELELTYSLNSDYERFEMLKRLVQKLLNVFSVAVLVVDELENASVKLAGQMSDGLRELLDSFSERFALVASFTAEKSEKWYDFGYTEYLARRFDYRVKLGSLDEHTLSEFLRTHHNAYRKKGTNVRDEIFPFSEDSAAKLLELMSPEHHYPGYFLPNCEGIARIASEKGQGIDFSFVQSNFGKLRFK